MKSSKFLSVYYFLEAENTVSLGFIQYSKFTTTKMQRERADAVLFEPAYMLVQLLIVKCYVLLEQKKHFVPTEISP